MVWLFEYRLVGKSLDNFSQSFQKKSAKYGTYKKTLNQIKASKSGSKKKAKGMGSFIDSSDGGMNQKHTK